VEKDEKGDRNNSKSEQGGKNLHHKGKLESTLEGVLLVGAEDRPKPDRPSQ